MRRVKGSWGLREFDSQTKVLPSNPLIKILSSCTLQAPILVLTAPTKNPKHPHESGCKPLKTQMVAMESPNLYFQLLEQSKLAYSSDKSESYSLGVVNWGSVL